MISFFVVHFLCFLYLLLLLYCISSLLRGSIRNHCATTCWSTTTTFSVLTQPQSQKSQQSLMISSSLPIQLKALHATHVTTKQMLQLSYDRAYPPRPHTSFYGNFPFSKTIQLFIVNLVRTLSCAFCCYLS